MQNIVIFIEPNEDAFITSEKIANLYMNRFLIDEDASNELLGIYQLGKSAYKFEGGNYTSLLHHKGHAKKEIDKKGLNKTHVYAGN